MSVTSTFYKANPHSIDPYVIRLVNDLETISVDGYLLVIWFPVLLKLPQPPNPIQSNHLVFNLKHMMYSQCLTHIFCFCQFFMLFKLVFNLYIIDCTLRAIRI